MSHTDTIGGPGISLGTLIESHVRTLRSLGDSLHSLIQDREDEFLALGSGLMEFDAQSRAVARGASDLADLCAGDEVNRSAEAMASELDTLQDICGTSATDESVQALDRTLDLVRTLDAQTAEFGRIIRSLQMLGISTRIESARLGDQGLGFSTLADDVEALAGKIVHDSSAIAAQARDLGALVLDASERTSAMGREQSMCAAGIVQEIKDALGALTSLMDNARRVSGDISARSGAMAASVGEVVSSLQFHDIVRQQVEHVEEAMEDMIGQCAARNPEDGEGREDGAEAEAGEDEASRDARRDLVGWLADVSELQVSQLVNASERFTSAVGGLRDGLEGIAAQAGELRADVASIMDTGSGGATVFSRVQESSGKVMGAMRQFSDKAGEIAGLIGDVAGTVSAMSGFVSDIEEVGSEIELIAINASIKAAHTGEEGKALGVLAQAIQSLSVEARNKTQAVSTVLLDVAEASKVLEAKSRDTGKAEALKQYAASQEELSEVLSRLDADLGERMRGVDSGSLNLGRDAAALAASIDLHERICPGLDQAAETLRGVVAASREAVPVADDSGRPERLKQMLSRYTMEVERLVHEAAFGEQGGGARTLRHEDEGGVELFGDDDGVELFGDDDSGGGDGDGEEWDNVELF